LLPCDFDSAKTRARYFGDCPEFVGKIVLRERIVWFQRSDGIREAPKENSAWFLWERSPLRIRRQPVILYAPAALCPRTDPPARSCWPPAGSRASRQRTTQVGPRQTGAGRGPVADPK
jgi:hypothetical protein